MAASSFAGKAYIVTGGCSGIGLETVRKLTAEGAIVHVIDKQPAPSDPTQATSGTVHYHGPADVSSRNDVTEVFTTITAISPRIDGLVNCAGICPGGDGFHPTDENFHLTMNVNVVGTWNCTTAFLGLLHNQKDIRASIVNLGSSASLCAWPTLAAYTASKHAVLGLTRSWSHDWAPKGVRCNLVAPGGTDTPLARAQLDDSAGRGEALSAGLALIPMGRMGQPQEQADAILFLLSEHSSYITGQVLPVNGGFP